MSKKVVYLDQALLSNLVRASHPQLGREGHHTDFYRRAFVQLLKLVHHQAVVCPLSRTHEQESALDDRMAPALLGLLQCLSAGVRFEHTRLVENLQLARAVAAWNAGQPFVFDRSATSGAFLDDVHAWMPHARPFTSARWSPQDVAAMRLLREETVQDLAPVYADWQKGDRLDFAKRAALEGRRGYGITRLKLWFDRQLRFEAARAGERPADPNDEKALRFCPVMLALVALTKQGMEPNDAVPRVFEFFSTDLVLGVPAVYLGAMLNASLAREKERNNKPPSKADRGTSSDFDTISTLLPYCNAMFVDNKCAEYLGQKPLAAEVEKYECTIFSLRSRDDFLRYLANIEASVPQQQRQLAEQIYGPTPTVVLTRDGKTD